MITNINKAKYEDLLERFKNDREVIQKALSNLKRNKMKMRKLKCQTKPK